ncbi:Hypothetical predicted protein [Cloeon dipterum]|uniref:Uncharacterized protein n=1 Tax=Cloeon dipterum TaxID=197152 RepID=A0A8S1C6W4_9INSE|nr:Hypothetical predicted protein [Cloeon dipterum]
MLQIKSIEFRKVRVTRVHNPIGTVSQPVSKKEPLQILKVEEMVEIVELCQKDKLLEDQRKIIVEIRIKLDEKQKELEELRQSLDTQHLAVDRLEAEKQQLQQRLLEADEKLEKSLSRWCRRWCRAT